MKSKPQGNRFGSLFWKWPVLLLLLPCLAMAQPEHLPWDSALMPVYDTMTETQQSLFDLLYERLWGLEEKIDLPRGTSYEDAALVLAAIRRECPELCLPREGFAITYRQKTPELADSVTLRCDRTQVEADRAFWAETAPGLLAELPEDTAERAEVLAERLCARLPYDSSLAEEEKTPQAALRSGRAQCTAYAALYAALCRMAGIPAAVVEGNVPSGRHAWNLIWVDGSTVLADLTARDAGTSLPRESYQPDEIYQQLEELP